jgi:hypothetical protein
MQARGPVRSSRAGRGARLPPHARLPRVESSPQPRLIRALSSTV